MCSLKKLDKTSKYQFATIFLKSSAFTPHPCFSRLLDSHTITSPVIALTNRAVFHYEPQMHLSAGYFWWKNGNAVFSKIEALSPEPDIVIHGNVFLLMHCLHYWRNYTHSFAKT